MEFSQAINNFLTGIIIGSIGIQIYMAGSFFANYKACNKITKITKHFK